MAFANTEFEALKKKELARENKIKELEDKLLYQEYTTGAKTCVSSASASPPVVPKMYVK